MRLALVILGVFFFVMTVRSHARPLTYKEKIALIPTEKTFKVNKFMVEKIIPQDLDFHDFISYKLLKKSCEPLMKKHQSIIDATDELSDQADELIKLYGICAEGTLGLTNLYISYNQ